jgi:putative membrane protein
MWASGWWIFPLLVMAFVVLVCVLLITRGPWGHGHSRHDPTTTALEILNERFAKGEISKEELEEKRKLLARRV